MGRRSILYFAFAGIVSISACTRATYDIDKFSKKAHISPTLAISAVRGDIAFSDLVTPNDTIVFGEDNFVSLIFTRDSLLNLKPEDFSLLKGTVNQYNVGKLLSPGQDSQNALLGQWGATIDPDTLDLDIEDVLSHLSGEILVSDPSIKLSYKNSFVDPVFIDFKAAGRRYNNTIALDLAPFELDHPADTLQGPVLSDFIIDKRNSSLPTLVSMPPGKIIFSGSAVLNVSTENAHNDLSAGRVLIGTVEVTVPLQLRAHNLQFTDTTENFLADVFVQGSDLNWNDFELFRIDFDVKNGFPMGISLAMDLYDSVNNEILSSLESPDVLEAAPVNSNGKVTSAATSAASITFSEEFLNSIERSDRIIFRFTMNTTDNGAGDVRIYSDYRVDFRTTLILKPDIKLSLK
jgi:hypothetical protein